MPLESAIENGKAEIGNFSPLRCGKKQIGKGRWISVLGHESRRKELAALGEVFFKHWERGRRR
jgi:hypothetical protein